MIMKKLLFFSILAISFLFSQPDQGWDDDSLGVPGNLLVWGNVGIGTTSPSFKLDVIGTSGFSDLITQNQSADSDGFIQFGYDDKSAEYFKFHINSSGNAEIESSGDMHVGSNANDTYINTGTGDDILATLGDVAGVNKLIIRDNNNIEKATIDSDGNTQMDGTLSADGLGGSSYVMSIFGIGTASPAVNLDVVGGISNGIARVSGFEGWSALLQLYADKGDDNADKWDLISNVTNNVFQIRNNTSPFLTIETSGDVGIGDTSPDDKLDIQAGNLRFSTSDYGIRSGGIRRLDLISDGGGNSFKINDHTGGDTWFHINTSAEYVLFPTGNVGIGTTTPQSQLDVSTAVSTSVDIVADDDNNSADTDSQIRFLIDGQAGVGTQKGAIGYDQGANAFKMAYGAISNNHLVIDSDGKVGIGTATPGAKLDITGNVYLTGDIRQKSPVAPIFYRHIVGLVSITDNTWQTIASISDAINQKGFFHFRGFTSRGSASTVGYSHSVSAVGGWTIDSGSNFLASVVDVVSSNAEDGMTGTATFQIIEAGGFTVVQIKSDNSSNVAWDVFGEVVVMAYENSGDTNQVPSF